MAQLLALFVVVYVYVVSSLSLAHSEGETMKVTDDLKEGTTNKHCYTCTANKNNSECELNPEKLSPAVGLLDCPRDLCTIVRVEAFPTFAVTSFYRGCDKKVAMFETSNRCDSDANGRTCFTSCATDKCNNGDGRVLNQVSLQYARPIPPGMAGKAAILQSPVFVTILASTCSSLYYLLPYGRFF